MDYILGIIEETGPYQITEGGPVIGECITVLIRLILISHSVSYTDWCASFPSAKTTDIGLLLQITSLLRVLAESTLLNSKKSIAIQALYCLSPTMIQEKVATLSTEL